MLDLRRLSQQFSGFNAYQADRQRRRREKLARACEALADCSGAWEALRARVEREQPTALVAGLREAPDAAYPPRERPTPVTVVATDGSQIYPDRHLEPTCFVLNVSRVAFQYGTLERPLLAARPHFHYREDELLACFDEVLGALNAELVSALRDEKELAALLEASRAARRSGRPIIALADGTLIRWMIRRMHNRALEQELIRRYSEVLARFRAERIPLCSYISMPRNAELINLLRMHRNESPDDPPEKTLDGLTDRWLFEETLRPGERSATFFSFSHIQAEYEAGSRICYFYVRVPGRDGPGEVGRVEVPRWVAEEDALLDLVHGVILSECQKGGGYPVILSEAHEQAVIRAQEKEVFYRLMERGMAAQGLSVNGSRKRLSKRQPRL